MKYRLIIYKCFTKFAEFAVICHNELFVAVNKLPALIFDEHELLSISTDVVVRHRDG